MDDFEEDLDVEVTRASRNIERAEHDWFAKREQGCVLKRGLANDGLTLEV